jgi:phenylalanyl-tRNA synthetase beta chain
MKLSEVWLREWVDPPISSEELAEQFTLSGLEVEQLTRVAGDCLFDISVTPNRADCLSIAGLAREVALLNQLPLSAPTTVPALVTIEEAVSITVDNPAACPHYFGRVLKNIDAQVETPLWMQQKLQHCGIRPTHSIVVDITNYVQIELGQPLHAFDLASIEGAVTVRLAYAGEEVTGLDERHVLLEDDTLVVADQNQILAIAGIMGGQSSAVRPSTHQVLLESAHFDHRAISGRARRYGISSEAAHRFERGVDPLLPEQALERATILLLTYCGGDAGPLISVATPAAFPQPLTIHLNHHTLERLIGHHFDSTWVADQLTAMGCQLQSVEAGWQVVPPTWRFDLALAVDLIEEIARIYGYHRIPACIPQAPLNFQTHSEKKLPLNRLRTLLVDRGYQEAITYSFVDPEQQQRLHPQQPALILPHPISVKLSAMRLSLWSGLLGALLYNQHRQQQRIRLFEMGLRFIPDDQAEQGVLQERVIAGVISGDRDEAHWDLPHHSVDFFDIKGDVEALFALAGHSNTLQFKQSSHPALHPGQSATIYLRGELIGYLGALHPTVEQQLEIHGRTLVFELLVDPLLQCSVPHARKLSRFPVNRRDLAVVVSETVSAESVLELCKEIAKDELLQIKLFDIYRSEAVPSGYKSLAMSLWLQSSNRTLGEGEMAEIISRVVTALQQRFQAALRH